MSRWLRVACVCGAAAFVVAFRVHAEGDDSPAEAALSTSRASAALGGSDATKPPVKLASPVALAAVASLPSLQGESQAALDARKARAEAAKREKARKKAAAERRKKAAAKRRKAAAAKRKREAAAARRRAASKPATPATPAAPRPVAPVPTAAPQAPRTTYVPPPAPRPKSYVGKGFDSKG